ncbi:jerky protein homolog-like isoform X1 [Bacillus rossius redtenbacheri]|uniref:jerky protein homolog-like isoform X1 n=1 Tax=Bacillus rossius redtenbacheri TaxID=93214 RepID=UPI002FDCDACC
MPRKYKSDPRSKEHRPIDRKKVNLAVQAVKNGMTIRKAEEKFGVSKSALHRYLKQFRDNEGKHIDFKSKGGQTLLPSDFEKDIVECLQTCAGWGYPLSAFDLRCFVKYYLDREGKTIAKFKNNMPGYEWALRFLTRHKTGLSQRLCQNIKRSRAEVSPPVINKFFDELEATADGIPSHLIINYDETALSDDPGRRKLIFKRGCKYPERVMNQSKASVSVMFAVTSSGKMLSPYVIYKSTYLYDLWSEGGPPGTFYNRSKSGWMDGNCFLDWFKRVIIPYCRRFEGKKLLIGDNLSSHLSPTVVRLCEENEILFVFLPPNSTHLTQPLDVSLFRPLKMSWRKVLEETKAKAQGKHKPFDKKYFPSLLKKTMNLMERELEHNIQAGFAKAGIFPLNRKRVLDKLPSGHNEDEQKEQTVDSSLTEFLKTMRYGTSDEEVTRGRKKRLNVPAGRSVTVADLEGSDTSDSESEHVMSEHDELVLNRHTSSECEIPNGKEGEKDPTDGDWVKVRFAYDRGIKIFIGRIVKKFETDEHWYIGTFLRQSTKCSNIFVFPNVPDESYFSNNDILAVLNEPTVRRGRYSFTPNPLST